MLVPDDRQLLRVALVWRGGASNICGEGAHQDVLEVPGRPGGPGLSCELMLFDASGVWGCCVVRV